MTVLVACEFAGVVRDAFAARGADAWSCDLLPTERPGPHIQGDALEALRARPWDLLIAHPPCTVLSYAGTKYWNRPGRAEQREAAMVFFLALYNAPVPRVCIENPVGLPNTVFRKPDQVIQPFYFGESQRKATCLWLRGLMPLIHRRENELFGPRTHTDPPAPTYMDRVSGKRRYFTDAISGGARGAHERSRSFSAIAEAMAEQWGPNGGSHATEKG